jgi:septal ring factor EnvC (AmiA/AmiB activator)
MCQITQHAIQRGIERFKFKSAAEAEQQIRESWERAEYVGDWVDIEQGGKQRLFVDKETRRVLIVHADSDKILTVWNCKITNIADELLTDVIQLHIKRMKQIDRERRQFQRHVNKQRVVLESERDKLDEQIEEMQRQLYALQERRSEIEEALVDFERKLYELDQRKKHIVKSLSNCM